MIEKFAELMHAYRIADGTLEGASIVERRLSDLSGSFVDGRAYDAALAVGNPVIYRVESMEPANGPGDLHYGLATLYPGKVGREYFLTKGHFHSRRGAAEVYIGLSGEGRLLLEDEITGESRLEPLGEGRVVYVPGGVAHRTINTGDVPLVYFGVYPANAGHDYGTIATRNFAKVVLEKDGVPVLNDRIAS